MAKIIITSILLLKLFLPSLASAFVFDEEVCLKYGLGSNWRCSSSTPKAKDNSNELSANDILNSPIEPEEKAAALNELWEKQRKRAVITEDRKEIEKFLETHNIIVSKGMYFANNVQQVIDNNPKLANSESYYKNIVEKEIIDSSREEILANAHTRYGLVFVYNSACPHCGRQLPVLLDFKKKYHLNLLGITADGNSFDGIDENIEDPSIVNDPMIVALPTIILLDKKHPKKLFISKGITSFADLEQKIAQKIMQHENEEETIQ